MTSWASFESALESCFSCPPAFVQVEPLPLFYVRPPRETVFATKLRKLVRAKVYREIRHRAKREWKSVFLDHPGMSYDAYEARLYQINNIGRDPREYDAANMDSMALELKQDFLDKSRQDGEADIPLVAWGPMTVMDTGSLKFDLGALTSHTEEVEEEAEIGEERDRPLIATKDYRLTTTFQVDVDPSMALSQGDVASGLRRYGVDIELDVLSDVLQRRLVSFELELQGNGEGELKGFFNLVLKAR